MDELWIYLIEILILIGIGAARYRYSRGFSLVTRTRRIRDTLWPPPLAAAFAVSEAGIVRPHSPGLAEVVKIFETQWATSLTRTDRVLFVGLCLSQIGLWVSAILRDRSKISDRSHEFCLANLMLGIMSGMSRNLAAFCMGVSYLDLRHLRSYFILMSLLQSWTTTIAALSGLYLMVRELRALSNCGIADKST